MVWLRTFAIGGLLAACSQLARGEDALKTAAAEKPAFIQHQPQQVEGWTVQVDRRLLAPEHAELWQQGLRILSNHLYDISLRVPEDRLARLREVPIWVDLDHPLVNMQYHPDVGWLRSHSYDPAMAKVVHIPRIDRLIDLQKKYAQPMVILHELSHAYHDRVLGFDYPPIRGAYDRIVQGKRLESVLHMGGAQRRHYALTDHKEFFAEMTESYFGTNDFYPFVKAELSDLDPELVSVLEQVWRKDAVPAPAGENENKGESSCDGR